VAGTKHQQMAAISKQTQLSALNNIHNNFTHEA